MPRRPASRRIRRRFTNASYPLVLLRFEDGHEIRFTRGEAKTFDAFPGETIKVVAVWDPTSGDREVIAAKKAEQFEEAE